MKTLGIAGDPRKALDGARPYPLDLAVRWLRDLVIPPPFKGVPKRVPQSLKSDFKRDVTFQYTDKSFRIDKSLPNTGGSTFRNFIKLLIK